MRSICRIRGCRRIPGRRNKRRAAPVQDWGLQESDRDIRWHVGFTEIGYMGGGPEVRYLPRTAWPWRTLKESIRLGWTTKI